MGIAKNVTAAITTTGHSVANVNGSLPPSGNANVSSPTGSRAPMTTAAPGRAGRSLRSVISLAIATEAPPSAANNAATGLASAASTAAVVARPARRRWSATIAAIAGSIPNANASRPVNRLLAVAAPNHAEPTHASAPKWSWASTSNNAAVPTHASPAASCGVSAASIGGNSTL